MDDLEDSEWSDIPGYEGFYQAHPAGLIRNRAGFVMKPYQRKDGYQHVTLYINGKRITRFLHTLIGITFIPNPEGKPTLNHTRGKTANSVDDLEWADHSEQIRHAWATRLNKGSGRLEPEDVAKIRYDEETSSKTLAAKFEISIAHVNAIRSGRVWKDI